MKDYELEFHVDINVINHLGIGLYSSTPAALTELVANAWDADATAVTLTVDAVARMIVIEDDGHGMSVSDIKDKFLKVGYSRRVQSKNGDKSESGNRRVMGRKGIGKLSMFALADEILVSSKAADQEAIGFRIDVPVFRENLERHLTTKLEQFEPYAFAKGQGTRIELRRVLPTLKTTEGYLRVKLARRFSVIDDEHGFQVKLNGANITRADRGFYQYLQFEWSFDGTSAKELAQLAKNIAKLPPNSDGMAFECRARLPNLVTGESGSYEVTGFIGSVSLPRQLGSKEDSANAVSVFANGRAFDENVLPEVSNAMYYQNYLVGEIHADFLDNDRVDRATASREAIKKDDPKYQTLIRFIRETLSEVGDQWDDWRSDLGLDAKDPLNAAVIEWIDTLEDKRDKRTATRLMTSIKNSLVHPDEIKNEAAKKILYRGAIVGFEKLRLSKQLDRLAHVTDVLGPEFAAIFASLEQVEESAYAEITRQRLQVIRRFAEISGDAATLEKVAQKYLFEHLWLLDPTWDRVTGRAEMEKTLTEYLKRVQPDSSGARLDISYRASSGRHIVVELKKPSLTSLSYYDLYEQASKYRDALNAYYRQTDATNPPPPIDIYLLVGRVPTGFDEAKRESMAKLNAQIVTYEQLINDAKNSYQEYLSVSAATGPLEATLARLQ